MEVQRCELADRCGVGGFIDRVSVDPVWLKLVLTDASLV